MGVIETPGMETNSIMTTPRGLTMSVTPAVFQVDMFPLKLVLLLNV